MRLIGPPVRPTEPIRNLLHYSGGIYCDCTYKTRKLLTDLSAKCEFGALLTVILPPIS